MNDSTAARPDGRACQLSPVGSFVLGCLLAAPVIAQAQESAGATEDLAEVAVTVTRISGFTAPTPVTSIGVDELQMKAVRNVAELMRDVPALRENFNTGQVSAPIGTSNLDLRGLGANPTLLLLDGRRFGATDATGGVDVNPYNRQLLENIERLGLDVDRLISIHYAADGRRVGMDELWLAAGRTTARPGDIK